MGIILGIQRDGRFINDICARRSRINDLFDPTASRFVSIDNGAVIDVQIGHVWAIEMIDEVGRIAAKMTFDILISIAGGDQGVRILLLIRFA